MRNAILIVLLALASGSAAAEWLKIGETERVTAYADPATIRKNGSKVKMWALNDFKKTQPMVKGVTTGPYLSSKSRSEYDCDGEQMRMLAHAEHSENMGKGHIVFTTDTPSSWSAVYPESVGEEMWKFACGKK